jgi:hypothetical protein
MAAVAGSGELVFCGYSSVGVLHGVIELWRYRSAQACFDARVMARATPGWREAVRLAAGGAEEPEVGLVAGFQTSLLHPLAFSPMQ